MKHPVSAFRLEPRYLDRLEEVRRAMRAQDPGCRPTRSDALRAVINAGSFSVLGNVHSQPPNKEPNAA